MIIIIVVVVVVLVISKRTQPNTRIKCNEKKQAGVNNNKSQINGKWNSIVLLTPQN